MITTLNGKEFAKPLQRCIFGLISEVSERSKKTRIGTTDVFGGHLTDDELFQALEQELKAVAIQLNRENWK